MLRANKIYRFEPDYAIPPGETLKEIMESLDMSQEELAVKIALPVGVLHRILAGEEPIYPDTANKLESAMVFPRGCGI